MNKPRLDKKSVAKCDDVNAKRLKDNIKTVMENYFEDLDGHEPNNLYSLFLEQVEQPFFTAVMDYKKNNISHAVQMLGINRATLRSRLKKYSIE